MKRLFSFLILFMFVSVYTSAQVNTLVFNQTSGVYTEIAGDTTVAYAIRTATSGINSMDDELYANNSLPFAFTFNGTSYTNIQITSNGFITFGTTSPGGSLYSPISSTTAYSGCVAPDAEDMVGNRGITASATIGSDTLKGVSSFIGLGTGRVINGTGLLTDSTTIVEINQGAGWVRVSRTATSASTNGTYLACSGSIVRGTTGVVGNRVHTIQFKGIRHWTSSANLNYVNFQVKLYEVNNRVEIVYGSYSNNVSGTCQVGLRGATNTDYNNRTTTSNWSATTAGGTNSATCTISSSVVPSSGLTFYWTPALPNDVGTTANLAPGAVIIVGSAVIAPKATFKNFGSSNQLVPFNVTYSISGPVNYSSTKTDTISSGLSNNITFDSTFNPNTTGTYNVAIYTSLGSDANRNNDTLKTSFVVINPNYGLQSGYYFANSTTGASGAPSQPQACWKDTTGSTSLVVNNINAMTGAFTGSLDDGYWKISLGGSKKIRFFNNDYDTIRIGTNGIIAFQNYDPASSNWNPPANGIPGGTVLNAFYPLWWDQNWGLSTPSPTSRLSYKLAGNSLLITYDRAPRYAGVAGEYASFQVSFEVSSAPSANSRILLNFADTTGGKTGSVFARKYLADSMATHLIGMQNAAGTSALTYRFRNLNLLGSFTGTIVPGPVFDNPLGSLAFETGPDATNLKDQCKELVLYTRLEAIQLSRTDTIFVQTRDQSGSHALSEVSKSVFSLVSGAGIYAITNATFESSLYIVAMHRNSLPTWSANPKLFPSTLTTVSYDFTTNTCQAYGCNEVLIGGKASIFTGEVIKDGCVDLSDISVIFNDAAVFMGGPYLITDLNFDEFVDLSDITYATNNASNFVCEAPPPSPMPRGDMTNESAVLNYSADQLPANSVSKEQWQSMYMEGKINSEGQIIEVK